MSFPDVPLFDALTNQIAPFDGFGPIIRASQQMQRAFARTASELRTRVYDVFGVRLKTPEHIPDQLEDVIAEMWLTGWDPARGNLELFVNDFGVILADALHQSIGGHLVFRSLKEIIHLSCWWPSAAIEAFPCHRVYKRLLTKDGESLPYFARSVGQMVGPRRFRRQGKR